MTESNPELSEGQIEILVDFYTSVGGWKSWRYVINPDSPNFQGLIEMGYMECVAYARYKMTPSGARRIEPIVAARNL